MLNTISSLVSSIALGASAPATDVVDAEPATAKHKILVMNADTGAGSAMVHQLLVGRFRKSFAQVWCTVSCASRSGMLMDLGARVLEMSGEPDIAKLEEWLRCVDTLILVPDPACSMVVDHMEQYICAARQVRLKRCIMLSLMGADESSDVMFAKKLRRVEMCLEEAGIENHAVVRHNVFMNWILMWSAEAQTQRKMSMPIDKSATFAPLHMQDMMMFVAFLVSEHGHRFTQTMYELTGREQLTCDDIVQKCNEKLNTDIGYEQLTEQQAAQRLHKFLRNDTWVRMALDVCKLVNQGKMERVSDDEKTVLGEEPMSAEQFLEEYAMRFRPLEE